MSEAKATGRGCLFGASISVAIVTAIITLVYLGLTPSKNFPDTNVFDWASVPYLAVPALLVGVIVGLLYPVCAAVSVNICESLRNIAFPYDQTPWEDEVKPLMGSIWPLSLAYWLVITPFYAIINRLFK